MEALRSQKKLVIFLVFLVAATFFSIKGKSKDTWVEIKDFQLNYQPDRIKVDVSVQNNSDKPKVFDAFSLHCTGLDNRDVTFKVLNNQITSDLPVQHRTPIRLDANSSADITLIAEKNEFYRSPSDCQKAAISWKIHGGKNYYGKAISVAGI